MKCPLSLSAFYFIFYNLYYRIYFSNIRYTFIYTEFIYLSSFYLNSLEDLFNLVDIVIESNCDIIRDSIVIALTYRRVLKVLYIVDLQVNWQNV